MIAYTRATGRPWPVQNVCTIRADGSGGRCLTNDGHSHDPAWSPDGKRILFIHDSALKQKPAYRETDEFRSHHSVELSVMGADGRNRRVLRVIEPVIHSVAWSPDGETLAVSAARETTPDRPARVAIYLLPVNGQGPLRLAVQNGWTPSWSPDGGRLAFTVEHPRGRWTVHAANRDGSGDVRLTAPEVDSGSPAWSPDGRSIAFDQFTDSNRRQQVFLMQADGSELRELTSDPAWSCARPSWSPDGASVVVACRSADSLCGMGFYSTGQPMPDCTRRLFIVPVTKGSRQKPVKLMDHDGATPAFLPA